jgi:hypothetical protein
MIIKGRDKAKSLKQKEKEMSKKLLFWCFLFLYFCFQAISWQEAPT